MQHNNRLSEKTMLNTILTGQQSHQYVDRAKKLGKLYITLSLSVVQSSHQERFKEHKSKTRITELAIVKNCN